MKKEKKHRFRYECSNRLRSGIETFTYPPTPYIYYVYIP